MAEMTRIEQTNRLARDVATYMEGGATKVNRDWVFRHLLGRWNIGVCYGHSDIKATDLTILHQVEYALANLSPADLRRQADDLARATA